MKIFIGTLDTIAFVLYMVCIALNGLVAMGLIFRKNDNKRADYFMAFMLLAFALTCVHHVLALRNVFDNDPQWLFVPVYMTLALGTSLFFAVKLRLYPHYRFTGSDLKHFVLPAGQWLYFVILFFGFSVAYRQGLGRRFYSPFYGGLEMALYIATFYLYLFGAYRYTQLKISALRKNKEGGRPMFEALVLRRMLRVMIILFWINSAYIIIDFALYELLRLDMHDYRGFTRFGDFSFAAMAGWAGLSGGYLLVQLPYLNSSKLVFSFFKKILNKKAGR
ncbi:MAG TPA: hypothetical protein ENJ20_01935 [Bacteroidetes bacterium]|nr:hypothetical protein [Bacteroidota bacterium]